MLGFQTTVFPEQAIGQQDPVNQTILIELERIMNIAIKTKKILQELELKYDIIAQQ